MPKAARKRSSALSKNKRDDGKSILPKLDGKSVGREASVVGLMADHGKTDQNQHPSSSSSISLSRQPNTTMGESPAISRGQRKRLIKREKYLQRERMVMSSLKLRKQDEQAKRIDGLDALKEALLETVTKMPETQEEKTRPAQVVRSNRGKRSIVKKEVEHMKLVLEHPSFKANPLAAIHEHLTNTTSKQATAEDQSKPVPVKAKPAKKKKSRFRATRMKNR
jgi:Ribosome biogenesis protein SLX9